MQLLERQLTQVLRDSSKLGTYAAASLLSQQTDLIRQHVQDFSRLGQVVH